MRHHPDIIYKIATKDQWKTLQETGVFDEGDFDRESGFIHLSKADQVGKILRKRYAEVLPKLEKGEDVDIVIFELNVASYDDAIKYEPNSKGEPFPHLYGKIIPDHVGRTIDPREFLK